MIKNKYIEKCIHVYTFSNKKRQQLLKVSNYNNKISLGLHFMCENATK